MAGEASDSSIPLDLEDCLSARSSACSLASHNDGDSDGSLAALEMHEESTASCDRGLAAFDAYYRAQQLCNENVWKEVLKRLQLVLPPCVRISMSYEAGAGLNMTIPSGRCEQTTQALISMLSPWDPVPIPWCPGAYRLYGPNSVDEEGCYATELQCILSSAQLTGHLSRQESASMLPALALHIKPWHHVLELCAAPGSKTLQLLDMLHAHSEGLASPQGLLVANDAKPSRLQRLVGRARRVPAGPLLVTCLDGGRYEGVSRAQDGKEMNYDRILCDVPCSSDGTIRKARDICNRWSPELGLNRHELQLRILTRGIELLKPGGILAYSTCSLNPIECEAVVAAALARAAGAVETLHVDLPGLQLTQGLQSWKVPAPRASEKGAAGLFLYDAWEEVPETYKFNGRLRRSMFPPAAYCSSKGVADATSLQLQRCARLLPVHDDGSCFFLALLRRTECATPPRRGDRVIVRPVALEAVVRGPGTGRWIGRYRVLYDDGSTYYALPEDLMHIPAGQLDAQRGSDDASSTLHRPLLLQPVQDDAWQALKDFFGLESSPAEAENTGVMAFPREAFVHSLKSARGCKSLCIASSALLNVEKAPHPFAAARAVFYFSPQTYKGEDGESRREPFPWVPVAEAAASLTSYCSRRVVLVPFDVVRTLLSGGSVDVGSIGVDKYCRPGALILVPHATTDMSMEASLTVMTRFLTLVGISDGNRIQLQLKLKIRRCLTRMLDSFLSGVGAA